MNFEQEISEHLEKYDLDIRKSRNGRFMDQKVTPDVLNIISDCVLQHIKNNNCKEFLVKDIWNSEYTKENVLGMFNKPKLSDKKAKNEYDKFFGQPLKLLGYAKILKENKKGNRNIYEINNLKILEFISIKERNSLIFLKEYLKKVMIDSDFWENFKIFYEKEDLNSFKALKENFINFEITNTEINKELEPKRIFTKIINVFSFLYKKKGTKRGFLSKEIISFDELLYNRRNWRDIKKNKNETRKEWEERTQKQKEVYRKYSLDKAKRMIKDKYFPNSELIDDFSNGEATQVHHIFPKNEFPILESYLENLILLTPTQHQSKAHPNNNTRYIDKDYQLLCLLAKNKNIEKSLIQLKESFYSKEDYVFVLNNGLNLLNRFSIENEFNFIHDELLRIYNQN